MRERIHKILVTGGAGFIGSEFVRQAVGDNYKIIVVDKITYAGDPERLKSVKGKYKFYKADICDSKRMQSIFEKERPGVVVNFAAETHVDRSILDCKDFVKTNIVGAQVLLDISRKYKIERFIHVSTDEVYGEIKNGSFTEESPLKPNSPYAASKTAADLLIRSYVRTYNFPAVIVRPCNNYGPWQYPEKLIPLAVLKVLRGEKVPIYACGKNVREWLYVQDCARGILRVMEKGRIGEIYNLGSRQEKQNIEAIKFLLGILKKPVSTIVFVKDRPGHDLRYSLDSSKARSEMGWRPKLDFEKGLKMTVDWCVKNKDWLFEKLDNISSLYK